MVDADLLLVVLDGSADLTAEDRQLVQSSNVVEEWWHSTNLIYQHFVMSLKSRSTEV